MRMLTKTSSFMYGLIGIAVLLCGLNGTCKESAEETKETPSQESVEQGKTTEVPEQVSVSDGNNAFACDLYAELKAEAKGNLFFSPYSISTALAMTYAGAKGNTGKEMATVLHFDTDQKRFHTSFAELQNSINGIQEKGDILLSTANSLWLQKNYKFLQPFLDLTKEKYGAGFFSVNFAKSEAARKKINLWVEEKTEKKIKNLIQKGIISRLTKLILTNAVYFKGNWKTRFDTSRTRDAQFFIDGENTATVPFMYKSEKCKYYGDSTIQVLELPYKGDAISMVILLPRSKQGLSDLEQSLSEDMITGHSNNLNKQKVNILLPRFTMTSSFGLKKTLMAMGMKLPFTGKADFSGMTKKKELFIEEIIHKAFVDVNEEGTEAAAATAVVTRKLSMPMPPEEFKADHPFIFLIRENGSGIILFVGRLVNPKK